jgi:hypothetical protein
LPLLALVIFPQAGRLDAIGKQRDAVVLVGAQANYLHTGDSDMVVPAFTSDGHLAIEPPEV